MSIKLISKIWEWFATHVVTMLPLKLLNKIIELLPQRIVARLISSFKSLKIYKVSICGAEFLLEFGPRDDHYLDHKKNQMRNWEHEVLTLWASEVKNADIIIDVGAYLGVYSILAAKLGPGRVIAIEPNSKSFKQLERNLALNSLTNSVQTFQLAVGETPKSVFIITPHGRPYSSGSQVEDSPTERNLKMWESESEVQLVTLDSLVSSETHRVSLMKIDAEGYEFFILKGASNILRHGTPKMIIELLTNEQKFVVDGYLKNFGYEPGVAIESTKEATNFIYRKE